MKESKAELTDENLFHAVQNLGPKKTKTLQKLVNQNMDIEKLLKEEKNRQLAHSKNPIIQLDKLNINNNIKIQYERSQSSKY